MKIMHTGEGAVRSVKEVTPLSYKANPREGGPVPGCGTE